jgi:4-hydroxybenzoate polyprenyltransferase
VRKYFSFVKIEHTLFSLPLVFSGMFLASRGAMPGPGTIALVLAAATGARTVAFALNRIIDRHIDARNPRTATRDLPSGRMTIGEALGVMSAGLTLYFGSAYLLSPFCLTMSPIPLLVFGVYPTMKRYTPLAHFGVGLGLAMGPLGGWFAVSPSFENLVTPGLLSLFTSRFGRERALRYSGYLHLAAFAVLILLFVQSVLSLLALPLLFATGGLLYIEQKKAEDVELAFFKINAVAGFAVFAMILVGVWL